MSVASVTTELFFFMPVEKVICVSNVSDVNKKGDVRLWRQ